VKLPVTAATARRASAALPYVVPFAVFLAFLALQKLVPAPPEIELPLRVVLLAAVLAFFSRHVLDLRSSSPLNSTLLGLIVFVIWICPDLFFPAYRSSWLFQNAFTGHLESSIAPQSLANPVVLWSRIIRAVVLVPIIEELFWRGWLMRWLIEPRFERVALGTYAPGAFWITAILFASEHGPFWDVGLACGILYNWWMVRTKSLGDCILAHAVSNACLCGYVVATQRWEYWL
jgi:CAAX prenyl protease-like protein